MNKRPTIEVWMPLHFADITKACSRMSELEECAFLRLLRDHWLNGAPPDEDATLARIVRYGQAKWRKVRPALEPHFNLTAGLWVHEPTEARRLHALGVRAVRQGVANVRHDGCNRGAIAGANADAIADIRDLSSKSPISVDNNPSQDLATDSPVRVSGDVIPLGRGSCR